jgi:hypothetical protein
MTPRIKELAKQAGLMQTKWADADTEDERVRIWQESLNNPGSLAAFAELIIQECATVADNNYDRGFSPVGGFVKAHFGVDE